MGCRLGVGHNRTCCKSGCVRQPGPVGNASLTLQRVASCLTPMWWLSACKSAPLHSTCAVALLGGSSLVAPDAAAHILFYGAHVQASPPSCASCLTPMWWPSVGKLTLLCRRAVGADATLWYRPISPACHAGLQSALLRSTCVVSLLAACLLMPSLPLALSCSGKSTLLRSTCAVALLGGCGLMVPADAARIPFYGAYILRNFSGDSPLEEKSSFAMEMDDVR